MQGHENSVRDLAHRLGTYSYLFAGLFIGAAGVAAALSVLSRLGPVERDVSRWSAVAGLALLLAGDAWAIRARRWHPLSLHRQTRKGLMHGSLTDRSVAVRYGIDAGNGLTTYRMTSGIWAACLFSIVGLAPVGVVLAYAAGFASALALVVVWPAGGKSPEARALTAVRRVERLVGRGRAAQACYLALGVITLGTVSLQ